MAVEKDHLVHLGNYHPDEMIHPRYWPSLREKTDKLRSVRIQTDWRGNLHTDHFEAIYIALSPEEVEEYFSIREILARWKWLLLRRLPLFNES